MTTLFDIRIVGKGKSAADFIADILLASTEYSIIGKDMDGAIPLWNEGARRLYGCEPEEEVGKVLAESCGAFVVIGKPAEPQVIFDAVALALEQNHANNPGG